jgi:ornithine--oxo-acid transaminase
MRRGLLSKETHNTVVRFAPPLIITKEQIDSAVREIRATFAEMDPLFRKVA